MPPYVLPDALDDCLVKVLPDYNLRRRLVQSLKAALSGSPQPQRLFAYVESEDPRNPLVVLTFDGPEWELRAGHADEDTLLERCQKRYRRTHQIDGFRQYKAARYLVETRLTIHGRFLHELG